MIFKNLVVQTLANLGYMEKEIEIAISCFLKTNPEFISNFNEKLIERDKDEIEINLTTVIISLETILKKLNKTFN